MGQTVDLWSNARQRSINIVQDLRSKVSCEAYVIVGSCTPVIIKSASALDKISVPSNLSAFA